ncbi:hypothetical protein THIX_60534 [Thiomonas sp. X19]|nr:hypothetical protein THIX_60534 [Thiomonas sp. X19]
MLPDYPDIQIEISEDYGLTDIVAQGFDAEYGWANWWRRT